MEKRLGLIGAAVLSGCAFPGLDPYTGESYSPQDPGGGGGMLFLAYQAQGVRDGQPATISSAVVNFGEPVPNAERFEGGGCVGLRAKSAPGVVFPARDAGDLRIKGASDDYTCSIRNGVYACNVPDAEAFFAPGAKLSLLGRGGAEFGSFSSGSVAPPRAPTPSVDLATLAAAQGDVRVSWAPSDRPIPMTCLQVQTFAPEGYVNGLVQCDVDDADGQAIVPASVAAALDRNAAKTRVSLFSVDGSELVDRDGVLRAAYFGQGRFSEVVRTP